MTMQPNRRQTKKSLPVSIIVGTLLVPLSTVAALSLMKADASESAQSTGTTTVDTQQVAQIVFSDQNATAEDLAAACGPAGLQLVAAEEAGTISDVQQAALDALRGICEDLGTPLPGKPAPDPITKTVVVKNGQSASSQTIDDSATTSSTTEVVQEGTTEYSESEDHEEYEEHEEDHEEHDEYEKPEDSEDHAESTG